MIKLVSKLSQTKRTNSSSQVLVSVVLASIEARPEADPYYLTSYGSLASFPSPLTYPVTFQLGRNRFYPARLVAPVPQDVPAAPTLLAKASRPKHKQSNTL